MREVHSVWIVQHDESPDNTVLGVFATEKEAREYANLVHAEYANGVITTEFAIGYRHHDRVARYSC